MLPVRTVQIFARQPHQLFQFFPEMRGGSGEVLLKKRRSVTSDADGSATIDLPVGNWTCIAPSDFVETEKFEFTLVAGSAISLDVLLQSGSLGAPAYQYIDDQIRELKAETDPFPQYLSASAVEEATENLTLVYQTAKL